MWRLSKVIWRLIVEVFEQGTLRLSQLPQQLTEWHLPFVVFHQLHLVCDDNFWNRPSKVLCQLWSNLFLNSNHAIICWSFRNILPHVLMYTCLSAKRLSAQLSSEGFYIKPRLKPALHSVTYKLSCHLANRFSRNPYTFPWKNCPKPIHIMTHPSRSKPFCDRFLT